MQKIILAIVILAVYNVNAQPAKLPAEPVGPPQLTYPYDQAAIEERSPSFSWLPPVPVNIFLGLKYDLELVAVYPGQSAADAVQRNVPLYRQQDIAAPFLLYPQSAPALRTQQQYAWRIIAKNNGIAVGSSEVWQFRLKDAPAADSLLPANRPYIKLKKILEEGYTVFPEVLKLDYLNETGDSTWNYTVYDLSAGRKKIRLPLDTIPLVAGHNLIEYDARNNPDFADKHIYLLEIVNSRDEVWRLRFEYRRPSDEKK